MKKISGLFLVFLILSNLVIGQASLTPVGDGSKVHFTIKNFGFKTGGDFSGLKGTIKFDPEKFSTSSFDITVDAATIDTDNSSRDGHLKKAEYFDVATHKTIHFKSTKITRSSVAGRFYVFGQLTIKGVTRPVEFGFGATPKNGGYVFDGEFSINRRNFGVGGSSVSLSDNLTVSLAVFAK
ncbi:MAG: YceI family protein [Ferruginibacter sp.]